MEWFTAPGYWISRLVFERALAAIYLVAFLVAADQFRALIGVNGMLPVPRFVATVSFRQSPSLFQLRYGDGLFAAVAWTGALLSAALLAGLADAVPLWAAMVLWSVLWALYLSIVNVGQTWYAFGWESLLLETGFLTIFLGNDRVTPPVLVLWLLRWLLFRVEFGAGLIKMRGDRCWRDLTCLYYHHETQPMPGPLSWFFHHLPRPLHRVEALANHVAQLIIPVMLFTPQPVAGVAALILILTQLWLVASGNFSWLNWLTIVIALSAVGDHVAATVLPLPAQPRPGTTPGWYEALVIVLTAGVAVLSYWPARNLISPGQLMNYSFNRWHLVNAYGAFGSISRERLEVVVEGTDEPEITDRTVWREYGFKGKPGDPKRLPRQFAPYHLRLDWLMWFAGISPAYAHSWFLAFIVKLLENDRATLKLLRGNPFPDTPPTHIRALLYRYRFTDFKQLRETGAWWERSLVREYLPPVSRERAGSSRAW